MKKYIEKKAILTALIWGGMMLAPAVQAASLKDGEGMIARCLDHAARLKYPPMSVGVIDASGTLVAFKRQDGATPATADAALLKARTSLRLNAPTSVLGPVAAGDASYRDAFLLMQMTTLAGGIPIANEDGLVVGAIGVSGGLSEQDAECAQKALETASAKKK